MRAASFLTLAAAAIAARRPILVQSDPGVGKSALVALAALSAVARGAHGKGSGPACGSLLRKQTEVGAASDPVLQLDLRQEDARLAALVR